MLKGQAKTDYQREYMRKRRGSNTGLTAGSNKGLTDKLRAAGLNIEEGGRIVGVGKQVPWWDKPGEAVMDMPELDADGNAIPELT